jgi:hypothetical protein
MASFLIMMVTTSSPQSSWQPHHHVSSWEVWEIGNAWIQDWKHSRARNRALFSGKVAAVVADGGSLFPRFCASIGERGRQNVHRTVARARFHMSTTSSPSRWSHKVSQPVIESKTRTQLVHSMQMQAPLFLGPFIHSFLPSFIPSFVLSFIRSFVYSFVGSFVHSFIHSFICSSFPFISFHLVAFIHPYIHPAIH